jgi:hypothetical protein
MASSSNDKEKMPSDDDHQDLEPEGEVKIEGDRRRTTLMLSLCHRKYWSCEGP